MKQTPCSVCGGTDLNLVDGFYYCVECGTQDVNAQETVVESTMLADGTFALSASRKIHTILKDGVEMSGEWHRWHAYNFVLNGLVDQLISLGAKPSFKMKVLWVWQRYIQKFQERQDDSPSNSLYFDDDLDSSNTSNEKDDENPKRHKTKQYSNKYIERRRKSDVNRIKILTKNILLAILYVGLNLDKSEIQLFHLLAYINDGRLCLANCEKFVPKEIKIKNIPRWINFVKNNKVIAPHAIRKTAMSLFRGLNLGTPLIPDLRKLINSYAKELCLPNDFKELVLSLMNFFPPELIHMKDNDGYMTRIPDFEGYAMSYVIVAFKMCFGLDDDYEVKLSDAIDKVNTEENRLKCYKIGFLDETDRLFSFREWCNYIMFRKNLLCRYYLPLADKYGLEVNDYILMEQMEDRLKRKKELSDDVIMNILDKLAVNDSEEILSKSKFPPTLTPMSTYTEVIAKHIENQEVKLLLSEDFTQYSLKYACGGELLPIPEAEKFFTGISEENKTINKKIIGTLLSRNSELDLVYVKNCQNRNWLITKPPRKQHIILVKNNVNDCSDNENDNQSENDVDESDHHFSDEDGSKDNINESKIDECDSKDGLNNEIDEYESDNEERKSNSNHIDVENGNETKVRSVMSDYGYDSNLDSASEVQTKSDITISSTDDTIHRKLETIKEEDLNINIFDDTFIDLKDDVSDRVSSRLVFEEDVDIPFNECDELNETQSTLDSDVGIPNFDPNTFNRENVIKELILSACRKYKISVPNEFRENNNNKEKRKRKRNEDAGRTENDRPKRQCLRPGEYKREIEKILVDYYSALRFDVINQVSEQVRSAICNIQNRNDVSVTDTQWPNISDYNIDDLTNNDNNNEIDDQNVENDTEYHEDGNDELEQEDEQNIEDLLAKVIPKSDPKFDEKEYDIRQLYLRFKSEFKPEIVIDYDDPTLTEIIEKQIKEKKTSKAFQDEDEEKPISENELENQEESLNKHEITMDTEENKIMREIKKQNKVQLDPLIKNVKLYKNYKYWIRHYSTLRMRKCVEMKKPFDLELQENCPKSFNFVIQECAAVLDCSAFTLYKHVQNLEKGFDWLI